MQVLYLVELEFEMLVFAEGGKSEIPEKKTLGARQVPTPNPTHIWHRVGTEPGPHFFSESDAVKKSNRSQTKKLIQRLSLSWFTTDPLPSFLVKKKKLLKEEKPAEQAKQPLSPPPPFLAQGQDSPINGFS